ncbi:MAG: hypothetical protein Q8M93_19305 [Polaromonas sp.]|uniref:hypothetical protein n=1 Tax=Polaromonas sp. TaxID=1869339 RepID=UPI002489945F|nr:hypothetical protein [Polaromonas sp.]MDI1270901.1 hypothetical protein [Polaromonas sp.]MDO9112615.1 hypothetical protein [Polaromonas sp.]MDP1887256.1 hypothetical protein [Polaromonas sp.]MDP2450733.1 hypothetical protein [Polaromonas sp.]MDP3249097.1 hypothetical protein [Polaromonas sp.]
MPYYIYLIKPFAQLEKLSESGTFQQASIHAKRLRAEQTVDSPGKIKIMFADNELQAEDLLCQVRTPGPRGDD